MRISHRYKFVFFANPKTASESVRALLTPLADVEDVAFPATTPAFPFYSHMRPIEARDAFARLGWPFDSYYRFTFVRNPWTRLASLYRMIKSGDPAFRLSFRDWLRSSRPDGTGGGGDDRARWRKYGTYSLRAFAGDETGKLLVDDVFRMEDIDALPDVLRRRGLPLPDGIRLPHANASRGTLLDLRRLYSPHLIALVAERYAEEIERFGYTFPEVQPRSTCRA
jgi:hypothetical protein